MIQITWVEILLASWLLATLAFSIGFCALQYKKYSGSTVLGFNAGLDQGLSTETQ